MIARAAEAPQPVPLPVIPPTPAPPAPAPAPPAPAHAPPAPAHAPPAPAHAPSPEFTRGYEFAPPSGPAPAAPAPESFLSSEQNLGPASRAPAAPVAEAAPLATAGWIPEGLPEPERLKHERARRLARVLASDIAIYNKDKRERGVKEGNLVAVLGYEIKKSWEVYKERVTPELANSTPYFRDALNDMLAEGKKVF